MNLRAETVDIPWQIINGVLPEFAERKQLWLSCFAADSFDKVRDEVPVYVLSNNIQTLVLHICEA